MLVCFRVPTHYVLVMDLASAGSLTELPSGHGRGSIFSVRRTSDLRSTGSDVRRSSLAKLSALPFEAPFTKVNSHFYNVLNAQALYHAYCFR